MYRLFISAILTLLLASPIYAQEHGHWKTSPYTGEQKRLIKSLSDKEVEDLRKGAGSGFAKAAELNGYPGPSHLLELREEIQLDNEQVSRIQAIFERMRTDAVEEGERLIVREMALDAEFKDHTVTERTLLERLAEVEDSRRKLRLIHLSAHLETVAVLHSAQIDRYNVLRGYTDVKR